MLTHANAFQALLLQAADKGRGPRLFGESLQRARDAALPFMVGERFPAVYLEHPLIGDPFLDITVLLSNLDEGTRVDSPLAAGSGAMLDWYARARREHRNIACGFEIDSKDPALPMAAIHFQPRKHVELVEPFCEAVGEPDRARLYLGQGARMPEGWPLSFFGMFRGRPGSPLRACGYLDTSEAAACASDPSRLARRFDEMGFAAYDDAMIEQVCALMAVAPGALDFQIDVLPDGSLGETFAIDVQFEIKRPGLVQASFAEGLGAQVMGLFEDWGIADDRWRLGVQATFARALPVVLDDGGFGHYGLSLMPQWVKARWVGGVLQPSKLYLYARGGLLGDAAGA